MSYRHDPQRQQLWNDDDHRQQFVAVVVVAVVVAVVAVVTVTVVGVGVMMMRRVVWSQA